MAVDINAGVVVVGGHWSTVLDVVVSWCGMELLVSMLQCWLFASSSWVKSQEGFSDLDQSIPIYLPELGNVA